MKRPSEADTRADAETAATYFTALFARGVPLSAAASMTAMYLASLKATEDKIPGDEWKQS